LDKFMSADRHLPPSTGLQMGRNFGLKIRHTKKTPLKKIPWRFFISDSNKLQCAAEAAAAESPPPDLSGFVIQISAISATNIPADI
jgi:hypothetical protein